MVRQSSERLRSVRRPAIWIVAAGLACLTMMSVVALLAWDAFHQAFPPHAHLVLGAVPLALIAVASLLYRAASGPSRRQAFRAVVLAAAFLFWSANQLLPESSHAILLNDVAIALFVLDVFLTILSVN